MNKEENNVLSQPSATEETTPLLSKKETAGIYSKVTKVGECTSEPDWVPCPAFAGSSRTSDKNEASLSAADEAVLKEDIAKKIKKSDEEEMAEHISSYEGMVDIVSPSFGCGPFYGIWLCMCHCLSSFTIQLPLHILLLSLPISVGFMGVFRICTNIISLNNTAVMSKKQFAGVEHAQIYSSYRKDTPTEVIQRIISFLKEKLPGPLETAVDVGCGNGQSTVVLAPYFKHVYGSDVSKAQIEQAKETRALPNVTYTTSPAEKLTFKNGSVQLLTAATALHWFDLDTFLPEARRVLCVNGVMAVYGYRYMKPLFEDPQKAAEFDEIFDKYNKTKSPYSLKSKQYLMKENYKDVKFLFEEVIRCPDIRCTFKGKLSDVVNYVSTFSGFQNFKTIDSSSAEECLNSFRNRLNEIGASCNFSLEDPITLYHDYQLVLCRKGKEGLFA